MRRDCPLLDRVAVLPYEHAATELLGVTAQARAACAPCVRRRARPPVCPASRRAVPQPPPLAQCLFLVRPDSHVALRCEPLRPPVLYRYLRTQLGATKGVPAAPANAAWMGDGAPRGASAFDWFPAFVWLTILVSTFAIVAFGHYQVHIDLTLPASSIVVGVGLFVCVVGLLVSPSFESA